MPTPYELGAHAAGHRQMHDQVAAAPALLGGDKSSLDLFTPIPADPHRPTESDGAAPGLKDVTYAVAAALYAETYGPVSGRLRPQGSVAQTVQSWNSNLTTAYRNRLPKGRFERAFFRGGLWQICIGLIDADGVLQERIANGQQPERMPELIDLATVTRNILIHKGQNTAPLSHEGSHFDALRFCNSVLEGAEQSGVSDPEEKSAILAHSLPDLLHLAPFEIEGVNFATQTVLPTTDNQRFNDEFLIHQGEATRLNMQAIGQAVLAQMPNVALLRHRGCPVLYANTPYQGKPQRIFAVMFDVLGRVYGETGALTDPRKRELPLDPSKLTLVQRLKADTLLARAAGAQGRVRGTAYTVPNEHGH